MGWIQIKKTYLNKETIHNVKKEPMDWEKIISAFTSDTALISKMYEKLTKFCTKNTNNTISKLAKELGTHFTEEIEMMYKYMKKYTLSLVIRGMHLKATLRFHLTPIRLVIIRNTSNNKCWSGCGEKGSLIHCWWGWKLVQSLWKTVWRFHRQLEMDPSFDAVFPLLSLSSKDLKSAYYSDTVTSMFIAAKFMIARLCNQCRFASMDEWIKKLCYIYTMEYY